MLNQRLSKTLKDLLKMSNGSSKFSMAKFLNLHLYTEIYNTSLNHRPLGDVILKYISVFLCVLGIILNIFIIIIRSRRQMRSAINLMLSSLAVVDISLMLSYASFVFLFRTNRTLFMTLGAPCSSRELASFDIARHAVFHTARSAGNWMTVALALLRYLACRRDYTAYVITIGQAKGIVMGVVMFSVVVCSPRYLYTVERKNNVTECYMVKNLRDKNEEIFNKMESFLRVIFEDIGTNLFIVLFIILLIVEIRKGNKYRVQLMGDNASTPSNDGSSRTTKLLAIMLVFSVITGVPRVLKFLVAKIGVYKPGADLLLDEKLLDVFYILIILNSSINFVISCAISKKFLKMFRRVFRLSFSTISSAEVIEMQPHQL